jgi:uncharacterized membrane protein
MYASWLRFARRSPARMNLLIPGLLLFVGAHLLPSVPSLRAKLIRRIGPLPYKALFVLMTFAGLALMIMGKRWASFVPLWEPAAWSYDAARLLMPLAFILLACAYLPGNIKRFTRHPMLWGVALWAALHLLANGDLASVIIFAGLGAYALFAMWSQDRRSRGLQKARRPLAKDALAVGVGLLLYAMFTLLHRTFAGVPAFA